MPKSGPAEWEGTVKWLKQSRDGLFHGYTEKARPAEVFQIGKMAFISEGYSCFKSCLDTSQPDARTLNASVAIN